MLRQCFFPFPAPVLLEILTFFKLLVTLPGSDLRLMLVGGGATVLKKESILA